MNLLSRLRRMLLPAASSGTETTRAKAEGGDADAQFALGLEYGKRQASASNLAQVALWIRKAADQNHGQAQFKLGMMLAQGLGIPRDEAAALVWFRRAAEGGNSGAQHILGMKFHRSSMVPVQMDASESRIEAYKWFHLSAAQGYLGSDVACDRVTLDMTRDEVTEGNRRASAFLARVVEVRKGG